MELLRDNIISFLLSSAFGIVASILLFYLTSHPSNAEKIRKRLSSIILKRMQKELRRTESVSPDILSFVPHEFDVSLLKSIVMLGSWEPKKDAEWYRWIAIFDPQQPGILDKLVGRQGFYELRSFCHMEIPSPDSLVPSKVEVLDFDGDGIAEVHVTLRSTWADSTSIGPLILKKSRNSHWQILALPSISGLTSNILNGESPHPDNRIPPGQPFQFFGMSGTSDANLRPPLHELKNAGFYEDHWIVKQNGKSIPFVTLRNGGTYQVRRHPVKSYLHFATVAFFTDGQAVLSPHYAVVNFLVLGKTGLERDLHWNWGFPMVSVVPLRPTDIDMDSIAKAGIEAHIIGSTFFGYTEFERCMVGQQCLDGKELTF